MIIILVFTIVNIRLAESRIFMTPNAWLTIEEDSKDKIENLKLVDTSSVHNKEVPTKKNSVEPVQEPEHDATPFPKGKCTATDFFNATAKIHLKLSDTNLLDLLD